jgi:thioredoxin 1
MSNTRESFGDIIKGETPVLVDFFAEWCGPCKMMKPILEDLRKRMGDKVRILKIDIDKSPAAANALQIQSVPTLMLFKAGQQLWRQSGVVQAAELERIITTHTR